MDRPLWVILVLAVQAVLLTILFIVLARAKSGWKRLRVGLFAEREFNGGSKEKEEEES